MHFIPKISFQRILGWVVWHIGVVVIVFIVVCLGFFFALISGSVVLTQEKPHKENVKRLRVLSLKNVLLL